MFKLPKPYLSYSQVALWNKTKTHRDYIKKYFYGETPFVIKEMSFGRYISDNLEKDNLFELPEELVDVFITLPLSGISEQVIVKQMKGFYTISYLDKGCPNYSFVKEFKTGKKPWDEERVKNHKQLDFYDWCIWSNFGHIPENELIWLETKNDSKSEFGISLTGKVKRFERTIDKSELEAMEEMIIKTAEEISEGYIAYLNGENLAKKYNWR